DDFLQIDAPVNRGNSGGPTFDLHGRVVGVNTAIYSPSGGSVGIGFAIPSTVAGDVVQALRDKGFVSRGYIGVQIQNVTPAIQESLKLPNATGALVAEVQPNTPAARAGLEAGDVIVAVNGDKVEAPRDLSRRIAALGPKATADLRYLRNGREQTTKVTLESLPDQRADAARDTRGGDDEGDRGTRLGLRLAPGDNGVAVAEVEPDSPAARQGLQSGDTILEVAGRAVKRPAEVADAVRAARQENRKNVLLRVRSGQGTRFVALPTGGAS
ncbi:MAG TPA: PDZ domain-containing protein, partial [Beijerinckiaceae bacterium]